MPIYSFYRIVKDIIRTIFGGKFWRKFLIIILISIAIWFILHDKGYCTTDTEDINYEVYNYYDSIVNDFILRSSRNLQYFDLNAMQTTFVYFYYGNDDGSSYLNGKPISSNNLHYITWVKNYAFNGTLSTYDYLGNHNFPIYKMYGRTVYTVDARWLCY